MIHFQNICDSLPINICDSSVYVQDVESTHSTSWHLFTPPSAGAGMVDIIELHTESIANQLFSDLFSYDPKSEMWSNLLGLVQGPNLPARCSMGMAAWGHEIYLFGGLGVHGRPHTYYSIGPNWSIYQLQIINGSLTLYCCMGFYWSKLHGFGTFHENSILNIILLNQFS